MNIEYFLKEKTGHIKWFYKTAVKPFNNIKQAVEEEKEPYVPLPGEEYSEPPFLEEWIKAENGVQTVGHTCISMLSGILGLCLEKWGERLEGGRGGPSGATTSKDDWTTTKKKGWFADVIKKLEKLGFDVSSCPANASIMEQIVLCRNRIQHPDSLSSGITYSEKDTSKFSKPFFSSELELEMFGGDFKSGKFFFFLPSVSSTEEKMFEAISQVEGFFSWLESEYEKITRRQ